MSIWSLKIGLIAGALVAIATSGAVAGVIPKGHGIQIGNTDALKHQVGDRNRRGDAPKREKPSVQFSNRGGVKASVRWEDADSQEVVRLVLRRGRAVVWRGRVAAPCTAHMRAPGLCSGRR
jgi:phage tail tape-measure protein